ncbi:hypothetical protein [Dyadobacter sp. LHD-138]|uniref:hypothetical protein n=1 Tax=Dyadobacter sp. LHD-138 TaxID=3071413 RepID=UPI0027DF6CD8|nr:hypothetical protein [Dyadobacter sp. LHD-138]MDQ6478981.1 hypothetical protein [Dyadobacter sp. LHD-138]
MKDYTFEYINQKLLLILFGISVAVLAGLIACMSYLAPVIDKNISFILVLGGPVLIFWLNKGKLKRRCTAHLSSTSVSFNFDDNIENVEFTDLMSYKIEHYNGTTLVMKFHGRKKIKLVANGNFCDSTPMESFCQALEDAITKSNVTGLSEVMRAKSVFEQKWIPFFLTIMTAAVIWVVVHAYQSGKSVPVSIYTSIAIFLGMWGAYFKAKQKKSNTDL